MNSVSLIGIGVFTFLFYLVLVLTGCVFQGACPFHLNCQISWHEGVYNLSLLAINLINHFLINSSNSCKLCLDDPFFIPDIDEFVFSLFPRFL